MNGAKIASTFRESLTTPLYLGIICFRFQRKSKKRTGENFVFLFSPDPLFPETRIDTSLLSVFTFIVHILAS